MKVGVIGAGTMVLYKNTLEFGLFACIYKSVYTRIQKSF